MENFKKELEKKFKTTDIKIVKKIQSLWSSYGEILRISIGEKTYILKHIQLPNIQNVLMEGKKNSSVSHNRKVKSYQVEMNWYENYSSLCDDDCKIPKVEYISRNEKLQFILLEDLDVSGYLLRKDHLNIDEGKACLTWLANFHGKFLGKKMKDLWDIGTYWHLDTRPEEFEKMPHGRLKENALLIDEKLKNCKFQTVVHGDAKVENFCFSKDNDIAAVDFQYVGHGCGMKDVAYFIGSCFTEDECQLYESELLACYFNQLEKAVKKSDYPLKDFNELQKEWRFLYPWAWTDFYRFLEGWSPSHHKIHKYTKCLAEKVLNYNQKK